jgi:FAD/FMN-containing dehydrogenase
VEDALLIDLRALTGVTIAPDQKCATIQGGTLQGEVGNTLWAAGLGTPIGLIPSVGYVGWAVYGGYGPFSAHWGLGVDQIIAATIVNPDGEIIQADEALLEGIRGAGGLYGVILELVVKVYPISKVRPWYSDPNY